MSKAAEAKKLLQQILNFNPNFPITGVVTEITGTTCSVKLAGGLVVTDVRINATVSDELDSLTLEPAIDSDVLMLSGDGTLRNLYIIKVDKVANFIYCQDGLKIEFDSITKKVKIENGTVNLKDLFASVANIIKALKVGVITEGAPSGVPVADTLTAVADFETQFNNLLK